MNDNADAVPAEALGAMALALGRNEFFATALAALQEVVPFRDSDAVIVDIDLYAEEAPLLIGLQSPNGQYAAAIRDHYLTGAFRFCPEIRAVRNGLRHGVVSMAQYGAGHFLESPFYESFISLLESRNFYTLLGDLGDGRVVGWSISRFASDRDFTQRDDWALRQIAPLLIALLVRHCQLAVPRAEPDVHAVRKVQRLVADVLSRAADEPLTRRERQIAALIAEGYSGKDISRQLGIAPQTQSVHRRNIYRKLGIASQVELVTQILGEASRHLGE